MEASTLRQMQTQLGQVLDDAGSAVLVADLHHRISYSNAAAARLLGRPNLDLIGQTAGILAAPWTPVLEARPDQRISGYMDRLEVGAAERWIDWQVSPMRDGTDVVGWLVLIQDRTDYHRWERSARLAERLASTSLMVGTLAHELRNPLSGAKGMLELMRRWPDHERTKGYPELIIRELDQITHLLNEFLLLGRPAQIRYESVDLAALVAELAPMLQGEAAGRSGVVQADLVPVPLVEVDPAQMTQVILNLTRNAIEAAGQAGRVLLRLRPEGDWVTLTVCDSGVGLSSEVIENLFLPFFTTKERGLGLSLAITQAIMRNYGGSVEAANAADGGAEFTIRLPARTEADPEPQPAEAVLFLSNLMLRYEAEQALRAAGLRIISTQNAAEVLHVVRLPRPVALVVDPDTLNRLEVQEIRQTLLHTRVLVLGDPPALCDRAGLVVLQRPVEWTDLLAQIHSVLERPL